LSVYAQTNALAKVAMTGNYADLKGQLPNAALPIGLVYAANDNVLSGTNTIASLAVSGTLRLPVDSGPCSAAKAGMVRFAANRFEGCNGKAWVRLDAAQQELAWWALDEGSGTQIGCTVNPAYAGQLVGGAWLNGAECKVGACVQLAGNPGSYISLPVAPLQGLVDFTVSLWVRQTSATPEPFLFSVAIPGADNYMLLSAPKQPAWTHLVWRRSGGTTNLYMDGKIANNLIYANPSNPIDVKGGGLLIGQDQDAVGGNFEATQSFGGVIDEIKILGYAVTDADIAAGYP
jgi:hypothetical protein